MNRTYVKKSLAVAVILLFISVSVIPSTGTTDVKQITIPMSSGNTLYVGGSGPGNYTKIQDAINDANNGDTVFVYDDSSPYYEHVKVNKMINLVGEDKNTTIIDGNGTGDVVYVSADGVNISGFTIQNCQYTGYAGIKVSSSYNNIISNCNIILVTQISFGIWIWQSYNNIISDCNISVRDGLGVWVDWHSSNNSVYNCTFSECYNGYALSSSSNNRILNCHIQNNSDGINLAYSNQNIISGNIITNNNIGIILFKSSDTNLIYHNNFINNTQNAYDECNNSWDNGYPSCGNYWSDYSGIDNFSGKNQNILGQDGVGDTPYDLPCEYATDWYPLMEPYGMTKLAIGNILAGLFKSSGVIKNIGNKTAFNVQWKITIDGGIIILGRESSGTIQRPLLPGEETTVSSKFVLGFGHITITVAVWADNAPYAEYKRDAFVFLFFIKVNPGGGI